MLGSYIKQKMRFFVAKVNLERMQALNNGYLRPLQVRYDTAKFMLPLRLGTVNSNGPQDLIILALSKNGRVETANYRTVKLPSNIEVPLYVKQEFGPFYKAMFDRAVERENMQAVFVEYAWDMGWCDPCAADPLTNKELVELGARWIASDDEHAVTVRVRAPMPTSRGCTCATTRKTFPEDLVLLETKDRTQLPGPLHSAPSLAEGSELRGRREAIARRCRRASSKEATNLANLTGWSRSEIEARMAKTGQPLHGPK